MPPSFAGESRYQCKEIFQSRSPSSDRPERFSCSTAQEKINGLSSFTSNTVKDFHHLLQLRRVQRSSTLLDPVFNFSAGSLFASPAAAAGRAKTWKYTERNLGRWGRWMRLNIASCPQSRATVALGQSFKNIDSGLSFYSANLGSVPHVACLGPGCEDNRSALTVLLPYPLQNKIKIYKKKIFPVYFDEYGNGLLKRPRGPCKTPRATVTQQNLL